MKKSEILEKVNKLKELVKMTEDLAFDIHGAVVEMKISSRDAMFHCLKHIDEEGKEVYKSLVEESDYYDRMCNNLESALHQLTQGVTANLSKIN